ncbi:MAG: SPOR domain-containing protein [Desulfobacter sp.]|nr:SPOR domain-containing protein [Desulfobacter sp.]
MDLKFYDALNNPVRHEVKGRPEKSGEIIPSTEKPMPVRPRAADQAILVKLSRKKATLNRGAGSGQAFQEQIKSKKTPVKTGIKPVKKPIVSKKSPLPEKSSQPLKTAQKEDPRAVEARKTQSKGGYTIQVAAYKAFKDAVTHMAALEKKGVASYRVRGKKDGKTWYRVRTGAFADYDTAAARLKELKQAKIDGMIIKKEER